MVARIAINDGVAFRHVGTSLEALHGRLPEPANLLFLSAMDSQAAPSQLSILTILLSSSVVLATMTGVLYLVGGASLEGYQQSLGLSYLSGRQPAEYIFTGAELLLGWSVLLVLTFATLIGVFGNEFLASAKTKRFPRAWERRAFIAMMMIASVLLFWFILRTSDGRDLITKGACPVTSDGSAIMTTALLPFCSAVLVARLGFLFFQPRLIRLTFLVWGIVASVICLYTFGWDSGAARLYDKFDIVEVGSTSLPLLPQARLLVLGSDDKNLVVLTRDTNRPGHPQPRYLSRSEIKSFSVVGVASINDFFCKATPLPSSPVRH